MSTQGTAYYQSVAQQLAAQYGIPWDIFNAQIAQESGYDPSAVSSAGCIGIAQICDSVPFDPLDPIKSLNYMANRMSNAYNKYGNWPQALASYNAGPGAADSCGTNIGCYPSETQAYIASILGGDATVPGGVGAAVGTSGGIPAHVANLPVSAQTVIAVAVIGFILIAIAAVAMHSAKKVAA